MNWRSLTFRLLSFYSVLLLLLGVSFYLYTIWDFRRYSEQTIRSNVAARADEAWKTISSADVAHNKLAALIEQRFSPEAQDRFIRISTNGAVVYVSGKPVHNGFDPSSVPLARPSEKLRSRNLENLYLVSQTYRDTKGRAFVVESGQSSYFVSSVEKSLADSLLIGLPALLIIAGFGGYVLIQRALRPVELMINAAEAISFNNPQKRLPLVNSGDRIDALAVALNRMLDRLDGAYQHVSRFSIDAAHELRTPLAIIRGELEFIAGIRDLPSDVEASANSMLEETSRLSQIVESLLTLSRMDSFWGKRTHVEVDLISLTKEVMEQMQLLADEKRVTLEPSNGPGVCVAGDRDRLKQVLVNLVDNAIKYNVENGYVRAEVMAGVNRGIIAISDSGIGIGLDEQEFIFDRFYRVSSDRGEIGAGLGLAIVRSICHAHGGTVSVESNGFSGSRFVVEIPLHLPHVAGGERT